MLSALKRVAGPALELDILVVGPTRSYLRTQQGGATDGGGEGPGESGGEEIFKWDKKPLRGFGF